MSDPESHPTSFLSLQNLLMQLQLSNTRRFVDEMYLNYPEFPLSRNRSDQSIMFDETSSLGSGQTQAAPNGVQTRLSAPSRTSHRSPPLPQPTGLPQSSSRPPSRRPPEPTIAAVISPITPPSVVPNSSVPAASYDIDSARRYRTTLCPHWVATETCPKGLNCGLAHGREALRDEATNFAAIFQLIRLAAKYPARGPPPNQ